MANFSYRFKRPIFAHFAETNMYCLYPGEAGSQVFPSLIDGHTQTGK